VTNKAPTTVPTSAMNLTKITEQHIQSQQEKITKITITTTSQFNILLNLILSVPVDNCSSLTHTPATCINPKITLKNFNLPNTTHKNKLNSAQDFWVWLLFTRFRFYELFIDIYRFPYLISYFCILCYHQVLCF